MTKNSKNSTTDKTFGERLRFLRKKCGLSQVELSKKIGYKASASVSNIEKNAGPVDHSTLAQIAEVLNADLHWLITGKPCPKEAELDEARYQVLMRLAKYIARGLVELLGQREALEKDIASEKKRQVQGEEPEPGYLEMLQSQLLNVDILLSDYIEDQPWVSGALKEIEKNMKLSKSMKNP